MIKYLEIRDAMTSILTMAIKPTIHDDIDGIDITEYLFWNLSGYGVKSSVIILMDLHTANSTYNPNDWLDKGRTLYEAHKYIISHWNELKNGDVIDVEFILGESKKKKEPEWKNYI